MSGSRFDQLRISTTLANAGLQSYTDGVIGIEAIRVAAGTGLDLDTAGVSVNGEAATFKIPCRLRQSSNVTLVGGAPDTVDGVTVSLGDRILLDGQTTASEDGIYEVTTVGTGANGTWERTVDAPTGAEAAGWFIQVLEGTLENLYRVDAALGGATVGTDGWTLGVFSGSTATPGSGLVAGAGTDLDVNTGDGIAIASDRVVTQVSTASSAQQYGGLVRTRSADGSAAGTSNAGYVAVQTDDSGLEVNSSNQVALKAAGVTETELNTSVAGNGLTGGGGTALSVDPDTGISVSGTGVAFDATAADGNGLTGTGSVLTVDPDSETGGNIEPVNVTANGVGVDISSIAGTGIEADGSANLRLAAQGNGIAGGAGSTLSVNADTGISVSGSGVAIDTTSTVTFLATSVWTFPNGVTGEGLFVTGTPLDANHVVNKTYVDSVATGIRWLEPASVLEYVGTRTVAEINALTPFAGQAVVAGDAGTPTAGTSDLLAIGDIAEYDGTSWMIIVTNSGGFPPAATRAIIAYPASDTLFSPLTDGVDEGKIAEFGGASLTPTLTTPNDGDAILVTGENSVNENSAYVFDGTVPSGQWVQFSGAGQINAGTGLTKDGNTINAIAGDASIAMSADSFAVALEGAGAGAGGLVLAGTGLAVSADATSTGATASVVALTGNGVGIRVDDSTLEGSAAGGSLRIKDLGVTTGKLAADAVTEAKIGFSFREESFTAASFSLSGGNYVVSLANTAIATVKTYGFNECYRNGVADMTNTLAVDPATATEYRVTSTELQIGADITASGDDYRVRYISSATS